MLQISSQWTINFSAVRKYNILLIIVTKVSEKTKMSQILQ